MRTRVIFILATIFLTTIVACNSGDSATSSIDYAAVYPDFTAQFAAKVNLASLPNYASQTVPTYVTRDNTTAGNAITDQGALLGRVLFYDVNLSSSNTVSCSKCHVQGNAFGAAVDVSLGVNGTTARHSMRLSNPRFGQTVQFFWDRRAATLEIQTTQPIRNHTEMGFSGASGDGDITVLIAKLQALGYYRDLFKLVYGTETITEDRMQKALAQFVRSIQSFDSKFDRGRAVAVSDTVDFANFTADENAGKRLFLAAPGGGGAGCAGCHQPPTFDIDRNSLNNGVTGVIGGGTDLTVTRSPSLRDVVTSNGTSNGSFMHDASLVSLDAVVEHYNSGVQLNANLDPRLKPGGNPQRLNLTTPQKAQIVTFLKTLSGTDVYTNGKWSTPF